MQTTKEPTTELIEAFVLAAHGNFARVQELLPQHPALLNAVWARTDEDALAAAAHTGQRAIAEFLLEARAADDLRGGDARRNRSGHDVYPR